MGPVVPGQAVFGAHLLGEVSDTFDPRDAALEGGPSWGDVPASVAWEDQMQKGLKKVGICRALATIAGSSLLEHEMAVSCRLTKPSRQLTLASLGRAHL